MQEYAPDEQKELQDKAWGSNTGTMPWCNDSSHLHRVSVEVQMYLEGDLQEIEVTSQEPSCADLAWHHGTTAPWHHGRGLRMVYESYAIFRKLYQNLRPSPGSCL